MGDDLETEGAGRVLTLLAISSRAAKAGDQLSRGDSKFRSCWSGRRESRKASNLDMISQYCASESCSEAESVSSESVGY